ncbi:retinol-binding protein pinta-like [Bemisia tabaci]|uniref:retinol-binding protein pinta-like n=1 Tax=Bemisia tabaci TaxID=7038 RepID=UPI003B28D31E
MSCDKLEPSPDIIEESVKHLKEWMAKEPHLPTIEDEEWLKTFFYNNKFSLEKTKAKLAAYYTLKNEYPDIMKNRDPCSPALQQAREALMTCISLERTSAGYTMIYNKFSADPEALDLRNYAKRVLMLADAMHLEKFRLRPCIVITDCQHLNYRHILKMPPHVGSLGIILNGAYTERVKAFHLINAPPFVYKMVELVKRYLPAKMGNRVQVHAMGDEFIMESLDHEVLVRDYGGNGPSLAEVDDQCQQILEKHRAWFLEQDNVCADKSIKTGPYNPDEMRGSFRRLNID